MTIETIANASPVTPKASRFRFDTHAISAAAAPAPAPAPAPLRARRWGGPISSPPRLLESWSRTFLAIATAIVVELVRPSTASGRIWPAQHVLGSASGFWFVVARRRSAYALCAAISITSKYVDSAGNPTNFGIVARRRDAGAGVGYGRRSERAEQRAGYSCPRRWPWGGRSVRLSCAWSAACTSRSPTSGRSWPFAAPRRGRRSHPPAIRRRASRPDHRADVSAVYLLHDHRPEDHGLEPSRSWRS